MTVTYITQQIGTTWMKRIGQMSEYLEKKSLGAYWDLTFYAVASRVWNVKIIFKSWGYLWALIVSLACRFQVGNSKTMATGNSSLQWRLWMLFCFHDSTPYLISCTENRRDYYRLQYRCANPKTLSKKNRSQVSVDGFWDKIENCLLTDTQQTSIYSNLNRYLRTALFY